MKQLIRFFKRLHKDIDITFSISPFISISLLMIYSIILGAFGYLMGVNLFSQEVYSLNYIFQSLLFRAFIMLFFINFNVIFLYFLIGWFRKSRVPVKVIYSYYAVFGTVVFIIALILFFVVIVGYYILNIPLNILLIMFGIAVIIILTLTNLYPAILLFLSLKYEPIDVFWPIILCMVGIHIMTFILFRLWSALGIFMMWLT